MKKMEVEARVPENTAKGQKALGPVTISVDYAENLEEAKAMYGEEAILSNAFANWKVVIQQNIRTALKAGMDQAAIQAKLGNAKMGVAVAKAAVDPRDAWLAKFQASTPAERKQMRKELEERIAALTA